MTTTSTKPKRRLNAALNRKNCKNYYARNRAAILAARKERYDNDPDYRDRQQQAAKDRRAAAKKANGKATP